MLLTSVFKVHLRKYYFFFKVFVRELLIKNVFVSDSEK